MLNLSQGRRKTADQGVPIPQPFVSFDYNGIHFRRGSLSLIAAAPGGGKALSVDTPILTTAGWKTMGDVTVGDEVYGSDGRPTTVVAATGIMRDRRVYRIRFDDGEEVVADANHEWVVEDRRYRQGRKTSMTRLTTEDMASSYRLESGRRLNYSIPLVSIKGQDDDIPARPATKRRFIESVEQIESVPVKCIQVEAEDSLYLCGRGLVLTHNSALAQNIVTRGDGNGTVARTFYFSADSDAQTMFTRSAAMSTGYEMSEVERLMREGGMEMLDARVRQATAHINYSFKSTLDVDYMMDELTAYAHVYGEWPEVIVADNLSNIEVGVDDEWRGLGEASFFLMDLARDTGAAVIALHHVSGEHEAGGRPIPLSGLRGKVSKLPATILTLHRAQGLKVSVVKNRSGRADPGGNFGVELTADLARMSFEG